MGETTNELLDAQTAPGDVAIRIGNFDDIEPLREAGKEYNDEGKEGYSSIFGYTTMQLNKMRK